MTEQKKEEMQTYVTTDKAGPIVAGCRIPLMPKLGVELELTPAQAEYELALGTIILKKPPEKTPPEKTQTDPKAPPASNKIADKS